MSGSTILRGAAPTSLLALLLGAALLLSTASCAGAPPAPTAEWPLACSSFPPEGDPVADCARREAGGEIVVHPGVVPEGGEPGNVQTLMVDGTEEHGEVRGGAWGWIDRQGRVVVPVEHEREDLPPPPHG